MKHSKLSVVALISVALIGCGGGGDGSSAAAPSTTVVPRSDIENIFRLGVLSSDLISSHELGKLPFFAGFLVGVSNATGGSSTPASIACNAGGSALISISRSGVYQGFLANDSATLSFNNCSFTGAPNTYNGSAVLTSLNGARGLDSTLASLSNLQFRVASANLSVAQTSTRVVHNGSVNATFNSTANLVSINVIAQTAHSYAAYNPATAAVPTLNSTSSVGSVLASSNSTTTFALSYAGRISTSGASGVVATDITTPTAITGTRNATSGALIPDSGVMNVTETSTPVATRGTFSPRSLTISGDTDRNGTLDLTFTTIF